MKAMMAALAIAILLAANVPAQGFQTHPKPNKVKKHKGKKHRSR
jgi:hypothetical protein